MLLEYERTWSWFESNFWLRQERSFVRPSGPNLSKALLAYFISSQINGNMRLSGLDCGTDDLLKSSWNHVAHSFVLISPSSFDGSHCLPRLTNQGNSPRISMFIKYVSYPCLLSMSLKQYFVLKLNNTGCPKKNALLSLKAYNPGLEAAIWASRDSFGILWLWAFIWDQEVQNYVKASLRKTGLKLATLSQNLTLLYHRYSSPIKNVLQCLCQAQVPKTWAQLDWGWHYNLIGHIA